MERIFTIVYIFLLVALLIQPHAIRGHILSLSSAWTQTLVTLIIFGCAGLVYWVHHWEIRRRERERRRLQGEMVTLGKELTDSFEYIGTVNRKLPLLHELTSDLLRQPKLTRTDKKHALEKLLILATVSIAKVPWGVFRFVDLQHGRTLKEFFYHENTSQSAPNIGNKDILLALQQEKQESMDWRLISSSETEMPYRCVFVFPHAPSPHDPSLLQAVIDQAQLAYLYFYSPLFSTERG